MNITHDINGILKGLSLHKGSLVTDIKALIFLLPKTFHYIFFLEIRNLKIIFLITFQRNLICIKKEILTLPVPTFFPAQPLVSIAS